MQTRSLARARAERGWTFRGRPRGRFHSYTDTRLLEYLAELSVKHGIDLNEFFDKFVKAWKNRKSTCKKLTIECRRKTRASAIFLVTADSRVVAQFPIPEYLLRETDPLKEFAYVSGRRGHIFEKERESSGPTFPRTKESTKGTKQVSKRDYQHKMNSLHPKHELSPQV